MVTRQVSAGGPTVPLPVRLARLLPLTGLSPRQFAVVVTDVAAVLPPLRGRPWSQPLPVRVLLTLAALRTNLTERGLAAVFGTSQSTVNRVVTHLTAALSRLNPNPATDSDPGPWIIDGTLIPVHDHTRTALSKNYRRSVNTHVVIREADRSVVTVSHAWPGNRNDVVVARAELTDLLTRTTRDVLGDGGYRGPPWITSPARDRHGRIIRDHAWERHRRRRARVEHVLARLKDWQILRQCRRRGDAIDHATVAVAYLHNLKRRPDLRVNS